MLVNYLVLALMLLLVGLLIILGLIQAMAYVMLRPPRMTDGRAVWRLRRLGPEDLGLKYENISFTVKDISTGKQIKLGGWWMPSKIQSARCVILIHGFGDAKVGAIAFAPMLSAMHLNILAIDLRAHGQSEGKFTTAGVYEQHDVCEVITQLKNLLPEQTKQVMLFGISMGAAVAAATAILRDDITHLLMESPYASFAQAAMQHAQVLGAPGGFIQRWAFASAQQTANVDFATVRPVDLIVKVPCKLMVIQCEKDVFVTQEHRQLIDAAIESRRKLDRPTVSWTIENAHHNAGLYVDPEKYVQRVFEFFSDMGE